MTDDIVLKKAGEKILESDTETVNPLSKAYAGIVFLSPNGTKWYQSVGDNGIPIYVEVV